MDSCAECGFDWGSALALALSTVDAFPARVARLLGETGAGDHDLRLRARPAAGVWSPLEYIAHSGDAIDWYAGRIARVLTEHRPQLDGYDWDAHTAEQDYRRRRLADVLVATGRSCRRFTATTAGLDEAGWRREGIGSDGTPRTTARLALRAAHEAQHHLHDTATGLIEVRRG